MKNVALTEGKNKMISLLKDIFQYILSHMLQYIPLIQKTWNEVVRIELYSLKFAPDHLKTQGINERAVEDKLETVKYVPYHFKTKSMCERAIEDEPYNLKFVLDQYKTQKIFNKAAE